MVEAARLRRGRAVSRTARRFLEKRGNGAVLRPKAERGALRLQPALTRLQRLTASAWMRNILGQSMMVDFGLDSMDGRRSLLVDLSGLGLGAAQLVGSLLLSLLRRWRRASRCFPARGDAGRGCLVPFSTVAELWTRL